MCVRVWAEARGSAGEPMGQLGLDRWALKLGLADAGENHQCRVVRAGGQAGRCDGRRLFLTHVAAGFALSLILPLAMKLRLLWGATTASVLLGVAWTQGDHRLRGFRTPPPQQHHEHGEDPSKEAQGVRHCRHPVSIAWSLPHLQSCAP